MFDQAGFAGETFNTAETLVRLFTGVGPLVYDKSCFIAEVLPTLGTVVRLFSRVGLLMF